MPEVTGLTVDQSETFNLLVDRLRMKSRRNLLREAYYDAHRLIRSVTPVLPPQYYRLGLVLGWSAKAVDLLARRCKLEDYVWPDGDLGSLGYREVWDGNLLGSQVDQGLTAALIFSCGFVISTDTVPADASVPSSPPAWIHFKSALDATGEWDSRARRLTSLLSVVERNDHAEPTTYVLYLDYLTLTIEKAPSGRWKVAAAEESPWPVPADPLPYRPRLGRPFGSSRISRPVMSLQDQAARELVRLEGHMDVYSWPEFWMLGADQSIFKNPDGSMKSNFEVMLGRIKGIPDDEDAAEPRADVKQFPAASPEPHLAALNAFAKLFARETSLPDTALAITDFANPTSAESYDASQYELIAEAEGATDEWSPALRKAMIRTLAMANGETVVPESWASMDTRWRDPRYQSRAALADAGLKQIQAVPALAESEVGLELLGLDDQQIRRFQADQRRGRGSEVLQALQSGAAGQAVETQAERAATLKAQFDALGIAIRAGVDPKDAAARVGLDDLAFTGAVPVALRMPETDASSLEER